MTTTLQRYQRIAPWYDLLDLPFEYARYRRVRPLLFADLAGRVLEAGVGTGRNIPFYPAGASVVAIDPSPAMLARAERRRARLDAPVELRRMDVTRLDFAAASFDACAASFLFSVLDDALISPALRELGRVTRPGGLIRLLDMVCPRGRLRRSSAALWSPWAAWAYGARLGRPDPIGHDEAYLERIETREVVPGLLRLVTLRVPGRGSDSRTRSVRD